MQGQDNYTTTPTQRKEKQVDQTRREYNKKVLDRIASDPKFREELLDDPKGAIERAGLKWEGGDDEVTEYVFPMTINTGAGSGVSDMITCTPAPEGRGTSGMVTASCDPSQDKDPGKLPGDTVSGQQPIPQ